MIQALTFLDELIGALSGSGPSRNTLLVRSKLSNFANTMIEQFIDDLGLIKHRNGWEILKKDSPFVDALYFSRAVLEVFFTHSSKFHLPAFSFRSLIEIFCVSRQWERAAFTKNAKFFTAYPMAVYLHNEPPNRPPKFSGHPLIFKGKIRRFLKARLVSRSDANASFFLSLLLGVKKGTAVVSEEFQKQSFLDHREKMQVEPKTDWSHHVAFQECLKDLFSEFEVGKVRLFQASSSAAWECKRGDGGALSYIQEQFGEGSDNLIKIVEIGPNQVGEIRGFQPPILSDVLCFIEQKRGGIFRDPSFQSILRYAPSKVMVSAVLEPLKCRLITKGEPLPYFLSRFFQKAMWKHLFKMDPFKLIGRPLTAYDLQGILDREGQFTETEKSQMFWISGDYTAATDGLNMDYTKAVMEEALCYGDIPEQIKMSLRSVIYEQEVHYPKKFNKNGDLDPVLQRNGQLMGSTLSFPILCIVNYLAYYMSLQTFYPDRDWDIKDLPCLVNGDDILFRATPNFYNHWKEMVKKVGFELSLGKNYINRHYLTVNSQMFRYNSHTKKFREIKHLNCGLLMGKSKTGSQRKEEKRPIWAIYNKLIENCPNPERIHRRFIHYNRTLIEECTKKGTFNLFASLDQGGLGFVNDTVERNYTKFQRRFASFVQDMDEKAGVEGQIPGKKLGLVTKLESTALFKGLHRTYERLPLIGPLPEGYREVSSLEHIVPQNVSPIPQLDKDDYTFKLPSLGYMKRFREGIKSYTVPLMSIDKMGVQWNKWVERGGVPYQLSLGLTSDEEEDCETAGEQSQDWFVGPHGIMYQGKRRHLRVGGIPPPELELYDKIY